MKNTLLISFLLIPFMSIGCASPQEVAMSYSICNAAESSDANKGDGTYSPFIVRRDMPVVEGSSRTQEKIVVCWTEGGVEKTRYWVSKNVIFITDDTILVPRVMFSEKRTSASTTFIGEQTDEGFVPENANDTATISLSSHQLEDILNHQQPDVRVREV